MSLKFVPPKNQARYAYAVEYKKSAAKFKPYNDLGSAKNALQRKLHYDFTVGYILENVDGEWFVLHKVEKGYEHLPWHKEVEVGGWSRRYTIHRGVPMTRDEYAEWRLAVEREKKAEHEWSGIN